MSILLSAYHCGVFGGNKYDFISTGLGEHSHYINSSFSSLYCSFSFVDFAHMTITWQNTNGSIDTKQK